MWKMEVWLIKGGRLAREEAQGPVVVWPGDLFAVFSTRYLVTPLLLLFIFKYQKFKCGRHHFVFSSGCVTFKKIDNQQRHDLCFANNARETLGRPSAQIPREHLNTPFSSSLSLPSNKSFQPLSHYFILTPTNTQTLIHNVFWWQRQGFL